MPLLYSYWRSSASYRVRIALGLKGIVYEQRTVSLIEGAHLELDYRAVHPQGFLPAFVTDAGETLTQSVPIMEYLDEAYPETTPLLPADALGRARARAFAAAIACDIHPIQNLSVLKYLRAEYGQDDEGVAAWCRHWIGRGLSALEPVAASRTGAFLFGDAPGLAEACLAPQLYNARRFGVDVNALPALSAIDEACAALPAFQAARPEAQPDAPA